MALEANKNKVIAWIQTIRYTHGVLGEGYNTTYVCNGIVTL